MKLVSRVFESLRNYQREWVRGDVVAGLKVWAVLADGVRVVIARNIGQVRDVIQAAPGDSILDTAYPTVDEAVTRVVAER